MSGLHVSLAGSGRRIGFQALYLDFVLANLAASVDSVFYFVQAAFKIVVAGFQSIEDSDVVLISFDTVGDGVLVSLRNILVCWRNGFPIRRIVRVSASYFF